jgi:hypothetical protein
MDYEKRNVEPEKGSVGMLIMHPVFIGRVTHALLKQPGEVLRIFKT